MGRGCVVGFMPLDLCTGCVLPLPGSLPVCLSSSASPPWEASPVPWSLNSALCTSLKGVGGVCLHQESPEGQDLSTLSSTPSAQQVQYMEASARICRPFTGCSGARPRSQVSGLLALSSRGGSQGEEGFAERRQNDVVGETMPSIAPPGYSRPS